MAAWYVVLRRGGWAFDDNLYFGLARTQPLGDFVNADLLGHWAVGYKLVFWAIEHRMPIDYRWVLLMVLVVLGISAFLFGRVIGMLVQERWAPVLAAAYLAFCVLLIRSLEWFSAGLQTIPTLACDIVCLWAYLHYQRRPAVRWILVSAASILVGLLFYEKALLMPVLILALRVLVQTDELRPRAIGKAIWHERGIWAAYVVVILAYVLTRELDSAGSVGSTGLPTASQWLQMYWLMWSKSVVPAAFGFALTTPAYNSWQLGVGIVLELVVAAAILISVRRNRAAWRAWGGLAGCLFVLGLIVGVGRVRVLGPGAATDQRYLVECAWLVPLFVCLAFLGPRANRPADASITRSHGVRGRHLAAAFVLAGVGYASTSIATAVSWEDVWPGVAARGWETNVQVGLTALSARADRYVVADGAVPGFILQASFVPFNYLSFVLPHYGPPAAVDGPLAGPLYVVSPTGRIMRARLGAAVPPRAIANCGRAGAGVKVQEPMPSLPATTAAPYYAVISYETPETVRVPLFVDSGAGFPGTPNNYVVLMPGARRSIAWLGYGAPRDLLIASPVGAYACIRSIGVVRVRAAQ